jgi:hypothetical protein
MGLINFDLSISPDPPSLTMQVTLTPTSLLITPVNPDSISVSASPSTGTIVGGAIAGTILGVFIGGGVTVGVVYGAAEALGALLTKEIRGAIKDKAKCEETFAAPMGYTINAGGADIRLSAKTLAVSTYQGMLMAKGSLSVTAKEESTK